MAEFQANHSVDVEWLAYELRPAPIPLPDVSGADSERYRQGWARGVAPLAERFGVEMRYPTVKPRSRRAHEAAEYAREHGAFDAMRVALFRAYFVDGRDLDDIAVLAETATSVGLDATGLRQALADGLYTEKVETQEDTAAELGISAVPSIVIGNLLVEGAQPYGVLCQALAEYQRQTE